MQHYTEFKLFSLKLGRLKVAPYIFTLDLETTSIKESKESFVYIWMVGIDNNIYYGRTLNELKTFIIMINTSLKGKEAYMYIHNLGYDFHFLLNIFKFEDVFSRKAHKPMKARIEGTTINLRCTYLLTGHSLKDLSDNYNLPIKKLELDYNVYRDTNTVLTEEELDYCKNDCLVLYHYIKEVELKRWGKLDKIPLTKTGKVRKEFKEHLGRSSQFFASDNRHTSSQGLEVHLKLSKAFTGGYIHANDDLVDTTLTNVESWDKTSSYPYVMLTEKFPTGAFYKMLQPDLDRINTHEAFILKLRITDIITINKFPYLSYSKLDSSYDEELDNGRLVSADWIEITCTEIDFELIKECYQYESIEVLEMWVSPKAYLPKKFVTYIIELGKRKILNSIAYDNEPTTKNKQKLQDSKTDFNSTYGMLVTNNLRDDVILEGGQWSYNPMDLDRLAKEIQRKEDNKEYDMFPYAWGVWITAYAKYNLLHILYSNPQVEVCYIDTDCYKFRDIEENLDLKNAISVYNGNTEIKLKKIFTKYDLPLEDFNLLSSLGKFKYEGTYKEFRTLGSKKYCFRDNEGVLELRHSGFSRTAVEDLNDDINNFKDGFHIVNTGITLTHYNDNQSIPHNKYGVYLEEVEATFSKMSLVGASERVRSDYYLGL